MLSPLSVSLCALLTDRIGISWKALLLFLIPGTASLVFLFTSFQSSFNRFTIFNFYHCSNFFCPHGLMYRSNCTYVTPFPYWTFFSSKKCDKVIFYIRTSSLTLFSKMVHFCAYFVLLFPQTIYSEKNFSVALLISSTAFFRSDLEKYSIPYLFL